MPFSSTAQKVGVAIVALLLLLVLGYFGYQYYASSKTGGIQGSDALRQYDKKILTITSTDGKITGKIGLTFQEKTKTLLAAYNLIINDSYPSNNQFDQVYAGDLIKVDNDSEGSVSFINCYVTSAVADPFSISNVFSKPGCQNRVEDRSNYYLSTFSMTYTDYNNILKYTEFNVYDALPFWEDKPNEPGSRTNNSDRAVQEGKKVGAYTLVIKEN